MYCEKHQELLSIFRELFEREIKDLKKISKAIKFIFIEEIEDLKEMLIKLQELYIEKKETTDKRRLIFLKKNISLYKKRIDEIIEERKEEIIKVFDKRKDNQFIELLLEYIYIFFVLGSMIMDFYTSSRILRKFKDGTSPDNCIVMVGNSHIKNMIYIFERLNYKIEVLDYNIHPLTEEKTELFQCINMNKNLYESLFG
jgi:hypothetical protein